MSTLWASFPVPSAPPRAFTSPHRRLGADGRPLVAVVQNTVLNKKRDQEILASFGERCSSTGSFVRVRSSERPDFDRRRGGHLN